MRELEGVNLGSGTYPWAEVVGILATERVG